MTRALVGIDLGTSNTVVAAAGGNAETTAIVPIPQRIAPTLVESRALLPSMLYVGIEGELEPERSLDEADGWVLGELARSRGGEVPARLVASAKSWLCHGRVDRRAPILPWGESDAPKLSPVDASARLLERVARAWNTAHPNEVLSAQDVVLTVPASFDEDARELTLEAASRAGLTPRLLEEPQAAFYAAMARGALAPLEAKLAKEGRAHGLVLVCDVGGGTTDLSLLAVEVGSHFEEIRRVAVGRHLLLGGDNMDLALAHALEPRLAKGEDRLDPARFAELALACRRAKERLFGDDSAGEERVALVGRGSALLGDTRRTTLTRAEAEAIVVEGFFPFVEASAAPAAPRTGLVAFGLPYERDVAVTRHVAAFLARHVPAGERVDAVLLNGGVFHAAPLARRLVEAVARLTGGPVIALDHDDPDRAVALGAVAYGRALRGHGKRIGGGSARAYFLGTTGADGAARAVCVVPKGTDEGARQALDSLPMRLVVGKPARFDWYSSDVAIEGGLGAIVDARDARLDALPPLVTVVRGAAAPKSGVAITLEAELTAVGTLELACVERDPPHTRHRLAFEARANDGEGRDAAGTGARRASAKAVDEALAELTRVFGKGTTTEARDAKGLLRELERLLGDREGWSAEVARALADRLLDHAKGRKRSVDHERVYLLVTGYCLRPGFGAPGDDERAARFAPLFAERVAFPKEARTWQQFFIAFRRVAGGLPEATQLAMRSELDPFVAPAEANLKRPKGPKPESCEPELLDLLGHLERVPAARRAQLGGWILERTWTKRDPRLWAALGRLGARVPAYASVHHVVAPRVAEEWLDHLLREKWGDLPTAGRAASELARRTGDRARDVSESMRREVLRKLDREGADRALLQVVAEVVDVAADERATFFGERLPSGLSLVSP